MTSRQQLRATGYSGDEIDRMVAAGGLVRIRRGLCTSGTTDPDTPEAEHLRRVRAVVATVRPDHVVSHVSAAVVDDFPVSRQALSRVNLTRPRTGGGKQRGDVVVHTSPLPEADVVRRDDLTITSPARTFVDVARSASTGWAVGLGDQVVRRGTTTEKIEDVLRRQAGWPGIGRARRAAALLDPRSESVGESLSRVLLIKAGLAPTELQLPVVGLAGEVIGWVDLAWPEHRTIGELDGRITYARDPRTGRPPGDVVWAEKVREDLLRDLGWTVVRWTWADLWRPGLVETRVRRAFHRNRVSGTRQTTEVPLGRGASVVAGVPRVRGQRAAEPST